MKKNKAFTILEILVLIFILFVGIIFDKFLFVGFKNTVLDFDVKRNQDLEVLANGFITYVKYKGFIDENIENLSSYFTEISNKSNGANLCFLIPYYVDGLPFDPIVSKEVMREDMCLETAPEKKTGYFIRYDKDKKVIFLLARHSKTVVEKIVFLEDYISDKNKK